MNQPSSLLPSFRHSVIWLIRHPSFVLPFLFAVLLALFFILPLAALIWRAMTLDGGLALGDLALTSAITLSLGSTALTVFFTVLFGTPLAYFLARTDFPLRRLVITLVELPIVMPPVVAGLALLAAFGRRGLVGQWLAELGVSVTFSLTAVVMAQLFVSAPFYIRAAQSRFASLPREYEDAAAVDGADRWVMFWQIILPQSRRALLVGLILSWARAMGEFGATILFAGNLQGRTQTMPLLVYGALERDIRVTFIAALLLLGIALIVFMLARWLTDVDQLDSE
ncbi:MAG: ABC transporter permease [Chloroflexota bacterium]